MLRLIHNGHTWECNHGLKKSLEMNIVDITQIININSLKKQLTDFHKLFMKSWYQTVEATKSLNNLYCKLPFTWLLKTNGPMTNTTLHNRDNDKMTEWTEGQRQRALTEFVETYID